jgi:predicted ferric reductase
LIKIHIFLGVYGLFFVFTHPFLEMISYGKNLAFIFIPNLSSELNEHVTLGIIAIYLYLFLWLSSVLTRNKISYRLWRYLHYLSYPILFFALIHAVSIGTFLSTFILLKTYFLILMATFAVMVLYRLSQFLDVGKFPYVLFDKRTNQAGVTVYTFRPMAIHLIPKVGQFFFIKPSIFAESHPFTVMKFSEDTGELAFGIKAVGNFTNQLEAIAVGQTVFLDGPYGVFTSEGQNHEPKVIIAGGIGITPFVELISRFGDKNTKLFYANRYLKDAVLREEFKAQLGVNYVDVISSEEINDKLVVQGKLDEEVLTKYLSPEFIGQAKFFVCGSPSFMGGVFIALKKLGVKKEKIFTEEFSF